MEYIFPEKTNIGVYASASTSRIIKETSFLCDNYIATLGQIDNTKRTDNYLYFNLTGQATVQNPQGYIIILSRPVFALRIGWESLSSRSFAEAKLRTCTGNLSQILLEDLNKNHKNLMITSAKVGHKKKPPLGKTCKTSCYRAAAGEAEGKL